MEWINLLVTFLTSGLIIGFLEFLYYRRLNKAIKKNEAASGDLDNQMKSITLGETFLERVKAVDEAQQKLLEQQRLMLEEQDAKRDQQWLAQKSIMDDILSTVEALKDKVDNIEEYLDGEYKQFIKEKKSSKKKTTKQKTIEKVD